MKTGRIVLLSLAAFLTFSCGHRLEPDSGVIVDFAAEEQQLYMEPAPTGRADIVPDEENIPSPTADKKIVKEGRMGIRVGNIAQARENVTSLVSKYDGYYSNESYNDSHAQLSLNLVIRIPNQNYEAFISGLENAHNGKLLYKEIDAHDVTEEFLDIETRLANKRTYLARYRELVKRANTIKEVLEVEQQVRMLEEEIESAEGRLRYLGNQVSYSTLDLNLSEEVEYVSGDKESAWSRFKDSVATGWTIVVEIFYIIVQIWPLILIGAGLVIFFKRKNRRKK